VGLSFALSNTALAGSNPSGTGQPNQECEDIHPGHAASARGSAFNENGKAGTVYANPDSTGGIHSGNTHVVSQYDVACYQQSLRIANQSARTTLQSARTLQQNMGALHQSAGMLHQSIGMSMGHGHGR
jgi:hypothetical protein